MNTSTKLTTPSSAEKTPPSPVPKRLYRFALYGLSNSGKTCYLTALALERRPTLDGSTCAALPANENDDPDIQTGWTNLQTFTKAFEDGDLPVATSITDGTPKYRYTYSDAVLGEIRFEIHDYAGELLRPDNLTESIRKNFQDLDGIIVLAVVPKKNTKHSEIHGELKDLMASFNKLKANTNTERRCPIALVLTKWDRQSKIAVNGLENERETLDAFFQENPTFVNVRNSISNDIGAENFAVFPISALGHCDESDKPRNARPLQSYGLPFPFGWLARRVNEMDIARLNDLKTPNTLLFLPPFKFWGKGKFWGKTTNEATTLAEKLIKRLPERSKERISNVKKMRSQIAWRKMLRGIIAGGELALLGTILWGINDSIKWRIHEATINNPKSTEEQVDMARKWFANYAQSSWLSWKTPFRGIPPRCREKARRIVPPPPPIPLAMEFLNPKIAAIEEEIRRDTTFLGVWPNHPEKEKLKARILKNETRLAALRKEEELRIKIHEANTALNALQRELNSAKGLDANSRKIEELTQIIKECNSVKLLKKLNEIADGKMFERHKQILSEAGEEHLKTTELVQWYEFENDVRAKFDNGEIALALDKLLKRARRDDKWQKLTNEIFAQVIEKTNATVRNNGYRFGESKRFLEAMSQKMKDLDNASISGAEEILRGVNGIIEEVNDNEDKYYYSKVSNNASEATCDDYLQKCPTGAMRKAVEEYKDDLGKFRGEFDMQIGAKVYWSANAYANGWFVRDKNAVIVSVNGSEKINEEVDSKAREVYRSLHPFSIRAKLNDSLKITCKIVYQGKLGHRNNGECKEFTVKISEWANEKEEKKRKKVNIELLDGSVHRSTLVLEPLSDIPSKPKLPVWRK
jgi:GTPase SAR1 family protein